MRRRRRRPHDQPRRRPRDRRRHAARRRDRPSAAREIRTGRNPGTRRPAACATGQRPRAQRLSISRSVFQRVGRIGRTGRPIQPFSNIRLIPWIWDRAKVVGLTQSCDLQCELMPYIAYDRLNLPIPWIMLGYKGNFSQNALQLRDPGELGFLPRVRNRRQRGRSHPLRVVERHLIGGFGHPLLQQFIPLIAQTFALDCRHGCGAREVIPLLQVRHEGNFDVSVRRGRRTHARRR